MSMTGSEVPVFPTLDLLSHEFRVDPGPIFQQAHAEAPVFFIPELGVWAITRHADVMRVLNDHETFSQNAATMIPPPAELADRVSTAIMTEGLGTADPPFHTVIRKAVNTVFTRGRVRAAEANIQKLADELIDGFIADGHCDILNDYFYEISQRTVIDLLGLPNAEDILPRYREWTDDLVELFTARPAPGEQPVQTISDEKLFESWSRLADAADFLNEVCAERARNPQDDLISELALLRDDDGRPVLTPSQMLAMTVSLVSAGSHATANAMTQLLLLLDGDPQQLAEVRRDPAAMKNAIEEGLRLRGPGIGLFRWTNTDVEIAGVAIPANSRLMVMFAGAGLDEAKFACPMQFDIHRSNADEHLAFGRGRHFCLGAPLARSETEIAFETLWRRIPDLKIVRGDGLEYGPSIIAFMLTHLDVTWTPPKESGS